MPFRRLADVGDLFQAEGGRATLFCSLIRKGCKILCDGCSVYVDVQF